MDHLVRTLFISDRRVTRGEIRKFWILQIAPNDLLDGKIPIVEGECGFERLCTIWDTVTRKVDPFSVAKLFNDPRNGGCLSIYTQERREALDALTNLVQFSTYREEFSLANGIGLTDGNESLPIGYKTQWIAASSTNEGSQSWGVGRDV